MRTRAFSLFVAIVGAVALVSASGAATTKASRGLQINVSTRAAVIHYLRAIHVNPSGVVIQRGARNYAGANCPGKRWACTTTAHPVVQVATAGGRNTFACSTSNCAVVQVATAAAKTNKAACVKPTGLTQSCTINQSSATGDNLAVVFEAAGKTTAPTQTASYTASITQKATGASNSNTACVHQAINIDGSTNAKMGMPVNVALEAHQSIAITQDATGSGGNFAQSGADIRGTCTGGAVTQSQTLTSTVTGSGQITQNENAADNGANVTFDIEQNQGAGKGVASGTNTATFVQTNALTAIANSTHGPVVQTQSSGNGGLLATINQDSSGVSTATSTQTETQCEDAAKNGLKQCDTSDTGESDVPSGLTQTQSGPVRKGVGTSTQTGNGDDTFTVNQTSQQDNDIGNGQTNVVQGDCHTDGNCTVTQNTDVDGQQSTNTQSGQDVNTQTTCDGSECTSTGPGTGTGPSLTLLPNGLSVSNADVGEFGYGGMRGDGTGSIDVSGISGPVFAAFLYWHGPTNSEDPTSNASVTFNGQPVTGTNIGTASSNCWNFSNSQSYRADVTALVSGDGTYSLSNFTKTDADVNGVGLIVFYNDGNASDDRNVVLWNGNDSNVGSGTDPSGWDETLTGVPYPGSGSASLDFIVSDGQSADDGAISVNGTEIVPAGGIFQGDSTPHGTFDSSGDLWDVKSFSLPSNLLTTGSNNLEVTSPQASDCLSLVAVAANVPASAPPPPG